MSTESIYRVSAWWTSGRTGLAKCESAPNTIPFSELPERGGLRGRWTPEELLLCALAGSFTTKFQELARKAGLEFTDLEVEVEGSVHQDKRGRSFTGIEIRPRLTVGCGEEFVAGLDLLRQTKAECMISRAIALPQTLEARVEVARIPAASREEDCVARLGT